MFWNATKNFNSFAGLASCLMALGLGCSVSGTADLPAPVGLQAGPFDIGRGQSLDDEEDSGLLGSWSPENLYKRAKAAAGKGPNEQRAREYLRAGMQEFRAAVRTREKGRQKALLSAAKTLKAAADAWPNSSIQEEALFYAAESYFFADHYPKASEEYDRLVKHYENTQYMDTVAKRRFAIADYWIKHQKKDPDWVVTPNLNDEDRPRFDKFGHGLRVLNKIRLEDPSGSLADDATMRAAMAHYEAGRFLSADELFTDLRRSFPSSDHQFLAHLFGVRCKLKIYQGPSYSLQPMEDAEQLIRKIRIQFPQEADKHSEFFAEAWKEVRKNKALHDWQVAEYYDRRKEFRAARQYYQRIAQEYADTNLAEEARERIANISAKPEKPKQKLPWLTKLFPTPEREKPLVATGPLEKLRR